ncbi:unnamed protein product [Somion occarium]|uniref:Uncharacterized protein n=1 Tax=Somion occarium TaxID=3059160 RepID=A0ABP1DRE1_9APHY
MIYLDILLDLIGPYQALVLQSDSKTSMILTPQSTELYRYQPLFFVLYFTAALVPQQLFDPHLIASTVFELSLCYWVQRTYLSAGDLI